MLKLAYKLGTNFRNPSLKKHYNFLKDSEFWSKEKLEDYQIRKCKELLEFAYKHSEFYQQLFNVNNFNPADFTHLDQLKLLPPLNKATLIKKNKDIQSNYPFKKLIFSESSGTSGEPLSFFKNEEWDSHNRAGMFRSYSWHNVKPWEKNAYLWGYNINPRKAFKIKILDKLQNRYRLFSYNEKQIEHFIKKLKNARYLHGYSSMIYEISKLINKKELKFDHNLKMIKGTSEKIYESYQTEVQKAFGLKIINEYGAAESGLIAFECSEGSMHIIEENVIVEEENGEILVTNLLSKSFPIIRYKLGDQIELMNSKNCCECGRQHSVIKSVLGRVGKKIIGKYQHYPSLSFYYVFKNIAIKHKILLNYQAKQDSPGKVELNVEQNNQEFEPIIREELNKYFKKDIDFKINFGQNLHSMNGKLKDFITTIN